MGRIEGKGFGAMVMPSPIPLTGYEILENMPFKVNPVTRKLEEVPDEELHPPYQLQKG